MDLSVVDLSRWQFAVTVITHFLFVATTIGLYMITSIFEFMYAFGKGKNNEHYGRLAMFFAKLGFLSFGLGVVTGLVMELQFGMNWSAYAAFFGDIIGVPIALETLTAFFLETTLLGLWRFTWGKVNKKLHFVFGFLVLFTSLFSVFWIISVNAFMQNPVGFTMVDGAARLDSIGALIKNPQFWPQALHVFNGIMITGGLVTAGVSAWQILKKRHVAVFKKAIVIGLLLAVPFAIIQPVLGDQQTQVTWYTQPMKFAAIREAPQIDPQTPTADETQMLNYVNNLDTSAIADAYHQKYDSTVAASYQGHMNYKLPVNFLYTCMYLMDRGDWLFMIIITLALILLHSRTKSIEQHPSILRALGVVMWFPYITLIMGWTVAEVGRYPFVVYGVLTQLDAVSPVMTLPKIITSLSLFSVLDLTLLSSMIIIAHRIISKGAPRINDTYSEVANEVDFFGKGAGMNV